MDHHPADIPLPAEPQDREERTAALLGALEERILVLDSATGTALQGLDLTAEDFGGEDLDGCNEHLCLTRPDAVDGIHEVNLAAGADIVETNSFGGTPLVLAEYDLEEKAFALNEAAARIARAACARHDRRGRPRFVCGSMGPTTKSLAVTGGITFDELTENFRVQALGLMAGGADYLLLETCQDTLNVKAGLTGIESAFDSAGWSLPVAVSVTVESTGTMLAGQDAEALAVSLLHADLLYLGLNCATGPDQMSDHLRTISDLIRTRTACVPNAGLPDEEGCYHEGPQELCAVFSRFLDEGWLNLVGGCCGTGPDHVAALRDLVEDRSPRRPPYHQRAFISGLEAVELTDDNRPLFIGERTNVLGSPKFRKRVRGGLYEEAAEIGRTQVKAGAQAIDVCLQDPERDEVADMAAFLEKLLRMVKVPLVIDTTDAAVMEQALKQCQGKAVLNSINMEDGLERFDAVVPLARRYGAALVVGLIDEQGMAVDVPRKRAVASRSYRLLTEDYGVAPEDIWWDALTFPCATGDENYLGSAGLTIEAVRLLKAEFPGTRSTLGVSNVSFGLPPAGREVLNSVFLFHCTKAGLDTAIVNTQRLARYAEIPQEERALAEALIFLTPGDVEGGQRAVEAFAAHFRGRRTTVSAPREDLPLPERLARAVVEGSKTGLTADLDRALADSRWETALAIINGPLMKGMDEVGRLFNDNQLIVAEVLQSAEVMKAAVSHLEPHMEAADTGGRGTVLLATVKGDVHDIGKNLVDIILTNNGYRVVNLGIKVISERIIQAAKEHTPDVIGLSGLLVKSAQQMVITARDLSAAGIDTPLLVGGAALSRRFTHAKIAAAYEGLCTYAQDAMSGLKLVERMTSPDLRSALADEVAVLVEEDTAEAEARRAAQPASPPAPGQRTVRRDVPVPTPPGFDRRVREVDLDEAWSYINPQMLYGKHLGLKGLVRKLEARGDAKYVKLRRVVDELMHHARAGAMVCRTVRRFYPARASGDSIQLLDPETGEAAASWVFPRQPRGDRLCLADYVMENDHVALFTTTAGIGVRGHVEAWKAEGEYLKSHAFAALALETAEAAAEWVHARVREDWGFPDPEDFALRDVLAARYRGKRYSFGYPACPDLSGQRDLFRLLEPEETGLRLTEGDMMDPEASVSALVFHHPDARYFRA